MSGVSALSGQFHIFGRLVTASAGLQGKVAFVAKNDLGPSKSVTLKIFAPVSNLPARKEQARHQNAFMPEIA